MTIYSRFFEKVQKGLDGYNKGLPMGFGKLEGYIAGIQQGRYDVVFAEPGAGNESVSKGLSLL